ncbi:MAG: hypothetical protein HC821_04500 [Lewinella sp.]|nr:hypothetical protein [Lewinella sp.]
MLSGIGKLVANIIIGLLLLAFGYFGMNYLFSQKAEPPKREEEIRRKEVTTLTVKNGAVASTLDVQGRLVAFNKIALFSEVTGTLQSVGRPYKIGTYFEQGSPLLRIDNAEAKLGLQAQKATLLNSVAAIMPDLKIDYPESFAQWEAYLNGFNVDEPVKPLPEASGKADKLFIASKNLYTQYFNIKEAEERLSKIRGLCSI